MPARSYVQTFVPGPNAPRNLTVVMFDANPCIKDYRQSDDPSKWDPEDPGNDPHYQFNKNILAQTCGSAWLEKALAAAPKRDWLVVVAHELAYEVDEFDLVSLLEKYNVDLYINGHAHRLMHYTIDGRDYVTTGAGCMVKDDTIHPKDKAKILYDDDTTTGFTAHLLKSNDELHTHFYSAVRLAAAVVLPFRGSHRAPLPPTPEQHGTVQVCD